MITFNSLKTGFVIKNKLGTRNWIKEIITTEHKRIGDIAYVFCDDEYLGTMNAQYLKHHTLTDIITFDYTVGEILSGDIFISIDRVKENALLYKVNFENELARVMAHGVLHLIGYKDKSKEEKSTMREKENFYLSIKQ
jgi:rRNA maturation RNase YbeY